MSRLEDESSPTVKLAAFVGVLALLPLLEVLYDTEKAVNLVL